MQSIRVKLAGPTQRIRVKLARLTRRRGKVPESVDADACFVIAVFSLLEFPQSFYRRERSNWTINASRSHSVTHKL